MNNFMKKTVGVLLGWSLLMGAASADWALDNEIFSKAGAIDNTDAVC